MIKCPFMTKKEEIRILQKFINCLHGENWPNSEYVMKKILKIKKFDGLNDLKKKYKK